MMLPQGAMLPQVGHYKTLEEWAYALVAVLKEGQEQSGYADQGKVSKIGDTITGEITHDLAAGQVAIRSLKHTGLAPRVKEVLEADGSLSYWTYDAAGGTPRHAMNIKPNGGVGLPSRPLCNAYRGVGWEAFNSGNSYGILGQFQWQSGGWWAGGVVGPSGSALHVPKTGRYIVIMQNYLRSDSNGRINLRKSSDGATILMNHSSVISQDRTEVNVTVRDLVQSEYLYYTVDSGPAVIAYTGSGHSFVECIYLGDT